MEENTMIKIIKTITLTQEEYDRLQKNMDFLDRFEDEEQSIMAHEAGHMILLRKFFPFNTYTYGNHCVYDPYKNYDWDKLTVCKQHLMVYLAGHVAFCKISGMTRQDTQVVIEYLIASTNYPNGADLWKYQEFVEVIRQHYGVNLRLKKLVSKTYDALDVDAIQAEVEFQSNMKKTA